ncbi:MAG: DUF3601 domain-containing protein [Anaerolineae bacterium]
MFRRKRFDLPHVIETVLKIAQSHHADYLTSTFQQGTQGLLGVRDRWIVTFEMSSETTVRVSMQDTGDHRDAALSAEAQNDEELRAILDLWWSRIEWWRQRLSAYRLQPGHVYRVLQSFTDYHGNRFEPGARLTYEQQHFLPYHGGYTIEFREATLYLQENEHSAILNAFDLYFEDVSGT